MTHKSMIKMYIRQVLLEGEDTAGSVSRVSDSPDAGDYKRLEVTPEILQKSIAGKRFSLASGGEPAFVIIADNIPKKKVVIRPYSKYVTLISNEEKLKDKSEQETFSTPMRLAAIELSKTLPIRTLNEKSDFQLISNIAQSQDSWELHQPYEEIFWKDVSDASELSGNIDGLYIMQRNPQYLLPVSKLATVAGYSRVENFQCALSFPEAFTISVKYDLSDPQWSLAAACYYGYANNPIPNIVSMGIGALIGFFVGGPPGAWIGSGIAGTLWDVGFRFIVCRWAAANAKYDFLAVNALWILVCVIFETLTNYKAFQEAARVGVALAEVGLDPGIKTMKTINAAQYLESVVNTTFKESGFTKTWEIIPKVTRDEVIAKSVKMYSAEFGEGVLTKEAVEAAFKDGPWKIIKLVLTNLIVTGLAGYLGNEVAESCRQTILNELDKPDSWQKKLADSEAEMIKIVKQSYPPI